MNLSEDVIEGTLNADGTLELDQIPRLSPGRVKVILQAARVNMIPTRGLADVIDEIRKGQEARGYHGHSVEDIEASLDEGEDEYERKMEELYRGS